MKWKPEELRRIAETDDLRISPFREVGVTSGTPTFARLDVDPPGALDAVHDLANMPVQDEPQGVRHDLDASQKAAR